MSLALQVPSTCLSCSVVLGVSSVRALGVFCFVLLKHLTELLQAWRNLVLRLGAARSAALAKGAWHDSSALLRTFTVWRSVVAHHALLASIATARQAAARRRLLRASLEAWQAATCHHGSSVTTAALHRKRTLLHAWHTVVCLSLCGCVLEDAALHPMQRRAEIRNLCLVTPGKAVACCAGAQCAAASIPSGACYAIQGSDEFAHHLSSLAPMHTADQCTPWSSDSLSFAACPLIVASASITLQAALAVCCCIGAQRQACSPAACCSHPAGLASPCKYAPPYLLGAC